MPSGTHRTRLKNPWMTREILRLVRQKRRRWQALKRSPTKENEEEYRRIEKETANKIRNAKRKLERELVNDKDKNNSKFTR